MTSVFGSLRPLDGEAAARSAAGSIVTYVSGPDRARLERAKGIEPSYEAWEASVLPLNYARPVAFLTALRRWQERSDSNPTPGFWKPVLDWADRDDTARLGFHLTNPCLQQQLGSCTSGRSIASLRLACRSIVSMLGSSRASKVAAWRNHEYGLLMIAPNVEVKEFRPKAMLVILTTRAEADPWFSAPTKEALLQRPLPNGALKIVARGGLDWMVDSERDGGGDKEKTVLVNGPQVGINILR